MEFKNQGYTILPNIFNIKRLAILAVVLLFSVRSSSQLSANFNADVISGCSPLVVNFQDLSGGAPSQWIWTLGNGTTSFLSNPTTTYFAPGSYNVKLIVKSLSGADSLTKSQFITVYANPVIAFKVSDSIGCFPKTVMFTDNSLPGSGTITQRTWDFGDGNISNLPAPVHVYTHAGMYSVTLKVTNSVGCQKTFTRNNLIQLKNPDADFIFANTGGCESPMAISFTSQSIDAAVHEWDFADGSNAAGINPLHVFAVAGTYNVKLVITGLNGCKDSVIKPVVVGSIAADFTSATVCDGVFTNFINTSSPSPLSVAWNFGDGTVSTQTNPVKKFTSPGNYQVTLISDFGGCTDTIIKTVVVHPRPSSSFTQVGNLNKCAPASAINFNALQGGLNYQWLFGDGATGNTKNPSHVYTSYGSYDVTLITTSIAGCTDTLIKPGLVKIQAPDITGIGGVYEGCVPYLAEFTPVVSTIDPVVSWSWDFGDGTTSTAHFPTHLYSLPGVYTVTLVITTAGGCTDTLINTGAIRISNKPVAAFAAAPLVTCASAPVQFTNTTTGANSFLWIFNDGGFSSAENPVHQFGDTGVFTVTLIASNTGCRDTFTIVNYVRNDPPVGRYYTIRDCINPYEVQFRDSSSGGQTYLWRFGDGDSSTLRHPKHIYKAPGTYALEFTVYHGGCSYLSTGYVVIIDEHPTIVISDTAICRDVKVVFNAANINPANIVSYHWAFGNNVYLDTTASSAEYTYLQNGKYIPTLITTDALGCLDTVSNVAELNVYGPTAGFTNQPGVCINSTAVFQDTSGTDEIHIITKWTWDFGDGSSQQFSSGPFSHVYNAKGLYNVQLKVMDGFGCEDSISRLSAINVTNPIADFRSSDSVKCSSSAVTFNNLSDGLGLQYTWDFGDNTMSAALHPSHSYLTEGEFYVQLIVADQFGCKDSISRRQIVSDPVARFIASDSFAACPPLLVNLSNQSGSYANSVWDFGDGSSADFANPSHYYTYPGTYQLKLKTIGFGNCSDSAYKTIIVKGPTGSFSFSPSTICTNAAVSFIATSEDNNKYLWDFSDGNTVITDDSTVSHFYDAPGFYQPRMILIDTAGCEVPLVSPDTLKVLGVKAGISFAKNLFCDSATIQFLDSSVIHHDVPALYQWDFGDGTFSNIENPLHHYSTAGVYITKLTVTSQAGCIDSVTAISPVTIVNSPVIAINSNASVCVFDSVGFSGVVVQADSSYLQWNWNFANGKTSSLQNPSQSFDTDGIFHVTAMAVNISGCTGTAGVNILVHPLPNVSAGTDTMICRGNTYILQPSGAASYEWQNDATLTCGTCSSAVAAPVFDNVYYVTGTSAFGCKSTDSVAISVLQPFSVSVSADDSLCKGSAVQLKANGAGRFTWLPAAGLNNATINNPIANPSATTSYMVIGSDELNCFKDTGYVKISVFPVPLFNIIDNLITLPAGSQYAIKTSSSPDVTRWKWYPAKGLDCNDCPQPVLTANDNIVYQAEAKNDGGCATTDAVTVSVICNDGNVFIPNTFSPNKDGMNDVFYPRGKGITVIKNMKIFNRWGEMIFEKSNFSANDAAAGWNGSYKGSILTPDVYVYIVDVVCHNSAVFTLKGNVTLIR